MGISIAGLAYYLPERMLTNDDLLELVSQYVSNERVEELRKKLTMNRAIKRYFKNPDEKGIDMALKAAQRCLEKNNINPLEIDLIIYGGMLRDFVEPAMSIALQDILGAKNANAFDITNACNGFLNAMEVACLYIESGKYQKVLLVGAEDGSERIPWKKFNDRDYAIGFSALTVSDGAAAMVLQNGGPEKNFKLFQFKTFGKHRNLCQIPLGKGEDDLKINVKSKELALVAIELMSGFIPEFLSQATEFLGSVDLFLIHQVTGDPRKFCGSIDNELYLKNYVSFPEVGNTGSISIPLGLALAEENGRLKHGDRVAILVGASGFSYGGTAFIY